MKGNTLKPLKPFNIRVSHAFNSKHRPRGLECNAKGDRIAFAQPAIKIGAHMLSQNMRTLVVAYYYIISLFGCFIVLWEIRKRGNV